MSVRADIVAIVKKAEADIEAVLTENNVPFKWFESTNDHMVLQYTEESDGSEDEDEDDEPEEMHVVLSHDVNYG